MEKKGKVQITLFNFLVMSAVVVVVSSLTNLICQLIILNNKFRLKRILLSK